MTMLQWTAIFASSMRAVKIISILPIGSYLLNYLAPLKDLYCGPREFNRAIQQALEADSVERSVSSKLRWSLSGIARRLSAALAGFSWMRLKRHTPQTPGKFVDINPPAKLTLQEFQKSKHEWQDLPKVAYGWDNSSG